jgi:hypothetical protein
VKLARFVETPVFGNVQSSLAVPFPCYVLAAIAAGGDFHREVRRLPLLIYDVAVAFFISHRVCVEGY